MRNILFVPAEIERELNSDDAFTALMNIQGKAFRDVVGRKTMQLTLGEKSYFIKQHFGVGWAEIFKNWLSLKTPILGALTEVKAIQKLDAIGIATTPLVAFGQKGLNPASLKSFLLTEDLGNIISLEDLCLDWPQNPPSLRIKRRLIKAVAELAKVLHENAVNHRDFYLCHLCLDADKFKNGEINLFLIDLHRALIQKSPHTTNNMKDIAALYFSSMSIGLSPRDLLRFKKYYMPQNPKFWEQVESRALRLFDKFHSKKFQNRLKNEKSALDQ